MLTFTALLALTSLQVALVQGLRVLDPVWMSSPNEGAQRWNPELFKTMSFGHLPAAVDWMMIRFLADPAYSKLPKGVHPPAYYDLDLGTDLDPAFFELYILGANYLAVVRDDGVGARDLLLKGERFMKTDLASYPESFRKDYWSQAWSLPVTLAYVYLFELDQMPQAATAFEEAAQVAGAPPYLKQLSERLRQPDGQYEVGLKLLNFLIDGAKNLDAKVKLEQKRDSLTVGRYVFKLNEAFQHYAKAKAESLTPALWLAFQKANPGADHDPWGGKIEMDSAGKLITTTPHQKVMGLE